MQNKWNTLAAGDLASHKLFSVKVIDKGNKTLEAVEVYDIYRPTMKLYIKDKEAVRRLINHLLLIQKELS